MATISSTLRMIDSFSRPLDHMISGITKTIDVIEDLQNQAARPNEVSAAFLDAKNSMSLAKYELDKMLQTQEQLSDEVNRTQNNFGGVESVLKSISGIMAGIFSIRYGFAAFDNFREFDKGMREVFTLLPGISENAMAAMTEHMRFFRIKYGTEAQAATQALYQAISAGEPPKDVFDFMDTASKTAIGGVTNIATAVDGLSTVVNAYGRDVITAAETADLMFTAVKKGKTNFEEMARNLYNVVPIASSLNLEFGNVTAALATMTGQGVPTAQATTQIRQMLIELSKAGTSVSETFAQAAGVGFREFIAQGNNVADALTIIEQVAISTDRGINDLFSSVEAGNAALALTGTGMEKFLSDLEAMKDSAGAYEAAFETMANSADFELNQIRELINVYIEDFGQAFVPMLQGINNILTSGFLDPLAVSVLMFVTAVGYVAQFSSILANVLAPLSPIIWGLTAAALAYIAIKKLEGLTKKSLIAPTLQYIALIKREGFMKTLSLGPIGLVIVAVIAFIAVLAALMARFDFVRLGVINAINAIIGAVNWLLDMIRKIPGVGSTMGDFRLSTLSEDAFKFRNNPFGLPEFDFDYPDFDPSSGAAGMEIDKINRIGEIDRINSPVNIAEEDLRYLRDYAEREVLMSFDKLTADSQVFQEFYLSKKDAELLRSSAGKDFVQNFITIAPQVDVDAEINSKVDLEKEMEKMKEKTQEEIETGLSDLSVVLDG